ncbi:unnamed protein product, partial [Cuscuta epithymum]
MMVKDQLHLIEVSLLR